jgi:hypothetical protein
MIQNKQNNKNRNTRRENHSGLNKRGYPPTKQKRTRTKLAPAAGIRQNLTIANNRRIETSIRTQKRIQRPQTLQELPPLPSSPQNTHRLPTHNNFDILQQAILNQRTHIPRPLNMIKAHHRPQPTPTRAAHRRLQHPTQNIITIPPTPKTKPQKPTQPTKPTTKNNLNINAKKSNTTPQTDDTHPPTAKRTATTYANVTNGNINGAF